MLTVGEMSNRDGSSAGARGVRQQWGFLEGALVARPRVRVPCC